LISGWLRQTAVIELEPTDHPLTVEQRTDIMLERVQEIAETLLHALPAPRSRRGLSSGDLRMQKRAIGAQTRRARRECYSARIRCGIAMRRLANVTIDIPPSRLPALPQSGAIGAPAQQRRALHVAADAMGTHRLGPTTRRRTTRRGAVVGAARAMGAGPSAAERGRVGRRAPPP
jgi:hypothetical protein